MNSAILGAIITAIATIIAAFIASRSKNVRESGSSSTKYERIDFWNLIRLGFRWVVFLAVTAWVIALALDGNKSRGVQINQPQGVRLVNAPLTSPYVRPQTNSTFSQNTSELSKASRTLRSTTGDLQSTLESIKRTIDRWSR